VGKRQFQEIAMLKGMAEELLERSDLAIEFVVSLH
jgi:hypothetical protein